MENQDGTYLCKNERCHRHNRLHRIGTRCDYDITAYCHTCNKELWERDRQYSLSKFNGTYCAEHSPEKTNTGHKNLHKQKV